MTGLSGSLFSLQFVHEVMPVTLAGHLGEADREAARRRARAALSQRNALGPASSIRSVFDLAAMPLMRILGFRLSETSTIPSASLVAVLAADSDGPEMPAHLALLVTVWDAPLDRAWRDAVTHGIAVGAAWAFCHNGRLIRLVDARRTYSRRYMEIDVGLALSNPALFAVLWSLLRAAAFTPSSRGSLIDRALLLSDGHQVSVRASLQRGVHSSLSSLSGCFGLRGAGAPGDKFDQALTIIYRILFLLFAEARALVPLWHPTYREGYSIGTLADRALRGRRQGLWAALQAASRLAHAGCRAGELIVTPFNGRLFEPSHAPLAETARVPDETIATVLLSLSTEATAGGRRRVSYGDLGVEQLGTIYETVLGTVATSRRKTTGSFYTPRPLTEYLVRRTLHPLVEGRTLDEILSLRVLDLAMGSGAFLVAACRYLAAACERALSAEGEHPTPEDRTRLRGMVAQRCLYGVDVNPTAVHLARLSLWLATLAADRPLTFLDHRLRTGNSLIGASADDLARQPPGRARRISPSPLFDRETDLGPSIGETTVGRLQIAMEPGDTIQAVRSKERTLAALNGRGAPLQKWREIADLWCAAWFWPKGDSAPDSREYGALAAGLAGGNGQPELPEPLEHRRLTTARGVAAAMNFFHWTLEFPEVFYDTSGAPLASPGFHAIVGNPPWEMLRGDHEGGNRVVEFARSSGIYRLRGKGHVNLYQLFLERALSLLMPGGRIGVVLPSGLAIDRGSAHLRRALFERHDVDTIVGFENHNGVFPIHRSLRFLLITATAGRPTRAVACRFGERDLRLLDQIPDGGTPRDEYPVSLQRSLLSRLSGEDLMIPELRCALDVRIAEKAAASAFPLQSSEGWGVRFGRELNATDDRDAFSQPGNGLPVVEGKQLTPFVVDVAASMFTVAPGEARARLGHERFRRGRLAYRDVASAGNRLSLLAAIVPANTVTTHTLFCLKTPLPAADQQVLCALLNSFVVNYLARQRIGTHLSASIVEGLPVPRPERDSAAFEPLRRCAELLTVSPSDTAVGAELQARAARMYGLTADELSHVLDTFPLVPWEQRAAVLTVWRSLGSGG
ncbi:MAG TPA: N-6 DNA methylase [Vicinamibacterales bacterium]|nr:N-6 DNA methylase [Vicinamibacterales bacterium]